MWKSFVIYAIVVLMYSGTDCFTLKKKRKKGYVVCINECTPIGILLPCLCKCMWHFIVHNDKKSMWTSKMKLSMNDFKVMRTNMNFKECVQLSSFICGHFILTAIMSLQYATHMSLNHFKYLLFFFFFVSLITVKSINIKYNFFDVWNGPLKCCIMLICKFGNSWPWSSIKLLEENFI